MKKLKKSYNNGWILLIIVIVVGGAIVALIDSVIGIEITGTPIARIIHTAIRFTLGGVFGIIITRYI